MRLRHADLEFKLGTGAFAALVVLIVAGIGWELWRQSMLSVEKFGFSSRPNSRDMPSAMST